MKRGWEFGVVAGELVQGRLEQREHVTCVEFAPHSRERNKISTKFCKGNLLDIRYHFIIFKLAVVENKRPMVWKDMTIRPRRAPTS